MRTSVLLNPSQVLRIHSKSRKWRKLRDLKSKARSYWYGGADDIDNMLKEIEEESLGLGVHVEYVLHHFQQWLDEFMSKFDWQMDGHGPATLDDFIQHHIDLVLPRTSILEELWARN